MYRVILFLALAAISLPGFAVEPQEPDTQSIEDALDCPYLYQSVNVITGEYCENQTDVALKAPVPLILRRCYVSNDPLAQGWHFNHPNLLVEELDLSEGSASPHVRYEVDDSRRLRKIQTTTADGREYQQVTLDYREDKDTICELRAKGGKSFTYTFEKIPLNRGYHSYLLKSVEGPGGAFTAYHYQDHPRERKKIISRVERSEGEFLINEYYDKSANNVGGEIVTIADMNRDFRVGRVKAQKAPLGCDGKPHISNRFFYYQGYTEVYDALNNKTIYRYGNQQKLTAIESYGRDGRLYRAEKFYWNSAEQLVSRTLEDRNGTIYLCHHFTYDSLGNPVKHCLFGELTGEGIPQLKVGADGTPLNPASEGYTTLYRYSDDGMGHLLYQEEENGCVTRFHYLPGSELLSAKLVYDGTDLLVRQYYCYDDNLHLTAVIIDDGKVDDCADCYGVTERRITRFYPRSDNPGLGLPGMIEESYLDPETREEKLLLRKILTYSETGEVIREEIYDADGAHFSTSLQEYDQRGNIVRKEDTRGTYEAYAYDTAGRLLQEEKNGTTTRYTYDFCGRITRCEMITEGEQKEAKTFAYDLKGNQVRSVDLFGNETQREYDPYGRVSKIILPAIRTAPEKLENPVIEYTYDLLDNVSSVKDPKGHTTETVYNIRGKPIETVYPDGTRESFRYYKDGALRSKTERNGCVTTYKRDVFGRVLEETTYDSDGNRLSLAFKSYSSFHLLAETDSLGYTTTHYYDGAGRECETAVECDRGIKRAQTLYTSLGDVDAKKQWYGPGEDDYLIGIAERDEAHNVEAYALIDPTGTLIRRTTFKAADNSKEKVRHFYDHYNAHGENALLTEQNDGTGNRVRLTYNALGKPEKVETLSPLGETLAVKWIYYDLSGNKSLEIHEVFGRENPAVYSCSWQWGPLNRLESYAEAHGTAKERQTLYFYNAKGLLESVVKPDGVQLTYAYAPSGKIRRNTSSDGTIDDTFIYDEQQRLVRIEDNVQQTVTTRRYNNENLLVHETLGNALSLGSEYDLAGRRTKLLYPDGSYTAYHYRQGYLRSINRHAPSGEHRYAHHYQEYSLEGQVAKVEMAGAAGNIAYTYDEDGRPLAADSPFWKETVTYSDAGTIVERNVTDPEGTFTAAYEYSSMQQLTGETGPFSHTYSYDSVHNRTGLDGEKCRLDELGQLECQNGTAYTYDLNGNLREVHKNGTVTTYTYDAKNRLVAVLKSGSSKVAYQYDAFNRRLTKSAFKWDAQRKAWQLHQKELYLYDGSCEIGAADSSGKLKELRVLGQGKGAELGAAVAIELGSRTYAPIHDHRGSIACLIDIESKKACGWFRYGAFGKTRCGGTIDSPWAFSGKRLDPETGLYYFGQRFYDPDAGRWITKDPMGTPDGINRYAFVQNQPLNKIDPYGLFSWSDFWQSLLGTLKTAYENTIRTINALKNHLSFTDYIRPTAHGVCEAIFGKTILYLAGFYKDASETGIHGKGELNDKVRITLINGILNARADFKKSLDTLSETHGGVNVHYIFDATDGWTWDMLKALMVKMGYVSPQAKQLVETWRELIEEMGGVNGGGLIIHYAHSIGGTHTKAAMSLLTPEERKMIRVYTFGSPSMISNDGFESVTNFMSIRDGVCLLDPIGFFSGIFGLCDEIVPVGTWMGIPLVDHTFNGSAYFNIIKLLGQQFMELYVAGAG